MFKRLYDWWTRPTWDKFLGEQQAAVDAMTLADDLNDRLQRNASINSNLLLDLHEAKQVLRAMASCLEDFETVARFGCAPCKELMAEAHSLLNPDKKDA